MSKTHFFRVFKDAKGEYRWHEVKSSDIVSESGEGYLDKRDALDEAQKHAPKGVPIVLEDSSR